MKNEEIRDYACVPLAVAKADVPGDVQVGICTNTEPPTLRGARDITRKT